MTIRAGTPTDPFIGDLNVRIQVLARRGGTGVVLEGLWLVYMDGPRQYVRTKFDAIDGHNTPQNGTWNFNGRYNPDDAARGSTTDVTRYSLNPGNVKGLVWGPTGYYPFLNYQFDLYNAGFSGAITTPQVGYIVFKP